MQRVHMWAVLRFHETSVELVVRGDDGAEVTRLIIPPHVWLDTFLEHVGLARLSEWSGDQHEMRARVEYRALTELSPKVTIPRTTLSAP